MDRFIVLTGGRIVLHLVDLKSNMDRFIDENCIVFVVADTTFKIQYG